MNIRLTLRSDKKGTKKLTEKYGASMICVRYRYDKSTNKRYKTVELTVEETDWKRIKKKESQGNMVHIFIDYDEKNLSRKVWNTGGIFDRIKKKWKISFQKVSELGLQDRIFDHNNTGEYPFIAYTNIDDQAYIPICKNQYHI